MSYTTIPKVDQYYQGFLFTIDEYVYPDGHIAPRQCLLSKNLIELDVMPLVKLRKIAKQLNIPGLYRMNKNILLNYIRNSIIFE